MASIDAKEYPESASKSENISAMEQSSETSTVMEDREKTEQAESDQVSVEFNLSDPDQLAQQLARVDLTEEESTELLKEAYKVNKRLKAMLKTKQDKMLAQLRTQSADSQRSGYRVLPPISGKERGDVPMRSLKAYGQTSTKGGKQTSPKARTKSAKSKSAAQRPSWDDRFSYS